MSSQARTPTPTPRAARRTRPALLAIAWLATFPGAGPLASTTAAPHLLVVTGLSGEDYYRERFRAWSQTLIEVAESGLGIPAAHVTLLSETGAPSGSQAGDKVGDQAGRQMGNYSGDGGDAMDSSTRGPTSIGTRERLLDAIAQLGRRAAPDAPLVLVLIGHGSAQGEQALFNLPGPDLDAAALDEALAGLGGRRIIVVNAAPSSAPFIAALSRPGRIVITATASAAENQHTRFAEPLVRAFAHEAADADKDGRVSVLEAFRYADRETARAYEREGRLRTEHALLDDDGDGVGSRDPGAKDSGDGALAGRTHLDAAQAPQGDAALALALEARRLVERVAALRHEKPALERSRYHDQLEQLLLELARNRRAHRVMTGQ